MAKVVRRGTAFFDDDGDDDFDEDAFAAAERYAATHTVEQVICRSTAHKFDFDMPDDIKNHPDGSWTEVYSCERCGSYSTERTFRPNGFRPKRGGGKGHYSNDYRPAEDEGYGSMLVSRSGRAAMNLARREVLQKRINERAAALQARANSRKRKPKE